MTTLKDKKLKAAKAEYEKGNDATRELLVRIFGKGAFPKSIKIEDLELDDILKISKPSAEVLKIIQYKGEDETMQGLSALATIEQITKVYNEGKPIDWNNGVDKYCVWVDMRTASGAGFSRSLYVYWFARSVCGSRLCYITKERCLLAIKKFTHVYAKLFCIRNQVPNIYAKKATK